MTDRRNEAIVYDKHFVALQARNCRSLQALEGPPYKGSAETVGDGDI